MDIQDRFLSGCVVVAVADAQFGHPKTLLLKSHISRLINEGHRHIILNLEKLDMLDSFGLAVLISLLKLCRENAGSLSLCNVSESVSRLIAITRVERVLDIYSSESQAVQAYQHN
jgi:anti-anti-sigma factor